MLVYGKLNRLDRGAVFISTHRKARQPRQGKGDTAEARKMPEFSTLGRQRTSAGLSQGFVKRYRSSANVRILHAVTVGSLIKAIQFCFLRQVSKRSCTPDSRSAFPMLQNRNFGIHKVFPQFRFLPCKSILACRRTISFLDLPGRVVKDLAEVLQKE